MSNIKTRSGASTVPVTQRAAIPLTTAEPVRKYGTGQPLVKPEEEQRPASMLFTGVAIAGAAAWYWFKRKKR